MTRCSLLLLLLILTATGAWPQGRAPALDLGEGAEAIRIESPAGMVQYDEERNLLYGTERVVITYRERRLEADAIVFDPMTREAQAFGDVILDGPREHFEADSAWFNFRSEEGMAYNVRGYDGDIYMRGAEFRQLSGEEIIFRRAARNWDRLDTEEPEWVTPRYTTCEFPEPHVALRAREFDLYPSDRIFARHVVIEVLGTPVFYLPFFTRGLGAGQPWDIRAGYSSFLGGFVNVRYNYRHRLYEPDPVTGQLERKSAGHLRAGVDFFTRRGLAYAAEYGYTFDYGRHRGRWQTYMIDDRGREDDRRWLLHGAHRWQISDQLVGLIGADLVGDPEMYEDFFFFRDIERERGRQAERRVYGALTYTDEDFVSRISTDWRERLSRDRVTNFSEPSDNNDDFFFDRDGDGEEETDERFNDSRYGRVSERVEYRFSTNELQIGHLPLFYDLDLRAFGNLDAGLNRNSTGDDARVYGIDLYQSLLWQVRLTERLTLLVRGGLGVAASERDSDSFDIDGPFPRRVDNVIFEDDHSFYVGTDLTGDDGLNDFAIDGTEGAFDTELLDLDDVDTVWLYGDIATRLQARLSDALVAYAEWRLRESTGQSLGEFWAEAGNQTFLEDLYAYRLDEHWMELGLRHTLRRPDIASGIRYERNLQGHSEIYNAERIQRLSAYTSWRNAARTLQVALSGGLEETQLRHPSDSRELQQTSLFAGLNASVRPRSEIWYDNFAITAFFPLDDDPFATFDDDDRDNEIDENDGEISVSNLLNVKVSPVWNLQWFVRVTDRGDDGDDDDGDDDDGGGISGLGANGSTAIRLQRDLHDAILELGIAAKNDSFRSGDSGDERNRIEGTVSIRFRQSTQEPIGVARPTLIVPAGRAGEIDDGSSEVTLNLPQ